MNDRPFMCARQPTTAPSAIATEIQDMAFIGLPELLELVPCEAFTAKLTARTR
jgi:hypothetical protein